MTYPKDYIGISISQDTHQRLVNLKIDENETFDSVVNKLLDLEDKYTEIPEEIYEYEYMLNDGTSKLFRITFTEKAEIEYYNRKNFKFEKSIRAWYTGNRISEFELKKFVRFIVKESNLYVLYEMGKELTQNGVWIKRV